MSRTIREATQKDMPEIMKVMEAAKQIMRSSGNMSQWGEGYPSEAVITADIEREGAFVIEERETTGSCPHAGQHTGIVGYFAFLPSPEPTYYNIYDGQWTDDTLPYHVVHRIASYPDVHGVFNDIMHFCFARERNIRIDTHRDNTIMQHNIAKHGFTYCGIIYLASGDERLAYQKVLTKEETQQQTTDMRRGLIIFDFDGTLGDTRRNIVKTMQMTISELQLPQRSEEACASTIGLPLAGCFKALFPEAEEDLIARCEETYRRLFSENLQNMRPLPFPSVVEAITALSRMGYTLTIASSRSHASLVQLARDMGLTDHLSYLIGADDVVRAKPDAEPVENTLRAMHFEAGETLVVGDMAVDIRMGTNAGARTCGVTWGNGTRRELERAGADFIIDNIEQLIEVVNNL